MKILFIVRMSNSNKAGLFMATHNRIKALESSDVKLEVYNLKIYDNWLLFFIKTILKQDIAKKSSSHFIHEEIVYNNLYIKNTLFKKILLKFGIDYWYYKNLVRKIIVNNYDIVSAHWLVEQGSLAYYLKRFKKIPYTLTAHGSDIHTIPCKSKHNRKIIVRNLVNADATFFVSEQLKIEANKIGWKSDLRTAFVSYNGVDTNIFYALPMSTIKLLKEKENIKKLVVGFVGSLTKVKRADYLIRIFENIKSIVKEEVTFFVIGDGPLKEQIIAEAQKEKLLDIRIIGNVNQERLMQYYNIMDCLILPSENEGMGNVVLEAQACGTPVIATNTGGIPEVIANKKYLTNNNNSTIQKELSQKVKDVLLGNESIKESGKSWKDVTQKELNIFNNLYVKKLIK